MTMYKIIFSIIITSSIQMSEQNGVLCDKTRCEGMYSFDYKREDDYKVETTNTQLEIKSIGEKLKVLYAKREWLTIYCYGGSSLDSNTGCFESIMDKTPTCGKLRRWVEEDMCPTGWECSPDGSCWGTESSKCYDDQEKFDKGPSQVKYQGTRYFLFPYHTCVSSWGCFLEKTEVNVEVEELSGKTNYFYNTNDGDKVPIDINLYNVGNITKYKYKHCLLDVPPMERIEYVNATCYSNAKDNVLCVVENDGHPLDKVTIHFESNLIGIIRGYHASIVGPLYTVDSGKVVNVGKTDKHAHGNKWDKMAASMSRAASIEDIVELTTGIAGVQLQTLYNVNRLKSALMDVEELIQMIFKYTSLVDGRIINKVLKRKTEYTMNWITPNSFELCPCILSSVPTQSNCNEEIEYDQGKYNKRTEDSKCYDYSDRELKNISLFKEIDLSEIQIKFMDPTVADSDSDVWGGIINHRKEKEEKDLNEHGYKDIEDRIQDLENKMFGSYIKYFWITTAITTWVSFGMVVCGLIKK